MAAGTFAVSLALPTWVQPASAQIEAEITIDAEPADATPAAPAARSSRAVSRSDNRTARSERVEGGIAPPLLIDDDRIAALRQRLREPAIAEAFRYLRAEVDKTLTPLGEGHTPARRGELAAVALMHRLEGSPGRADRYTQYIAKELPTRFGFSGFDLDGVIALSWCYDALPAALREEAATRWVQGLDPLDRNTQPQDHAGLRRELVHLAMAVTLRGRRDQARVQPTVESLLRDADEIPLSRYFLLRGAVALTPQTASAERFNAVLFAELQRALDGDATWATLAETLGESYTLDYWLQLPHPAADGRTFVRDGGLVFASDPYASADGLEWLSPFLIATRTESASARWAAHQAFAGLLAEWSAENEREDAAVAQAAIEAMDRRPSRALRQVPPNQLHALWMPLLFVDTPAPPPTDSLPAGDAKRGLATFVPPGSVVLRGGMGMDDPVVLLDLGRPALSGSHWAHAGSFSVFRRGFLTGVAARDVEPLLRNPRRASTGIGDEPRTADDPLASFATFARDTVSSNGLLLINPPRTRDEQNANPWPIEGGQLLRFEPLPPPFTATDTTSPGRLLALAEDATMAYAAVDVSAAYGLDQSRRLIRQVLLLPPDDLIIIDRVRPTSGFMRPVFLLQLASRPLVADEALPEKALARGRRDAGLWQMPADAALSLTSGEGAMTVRTLYPADANWRITGGPGEVDTIEKGDREGLPFLGSQPRGFEFWIGTREGIGGDNAWFDLVDPFRLPTSETFSLVEPPHWGRLQVHPPEPRNYEPGKPVDQLMVHWLHLGEAGLREAGLPPPTPVVRVADDRLVIRLPQQPEPGFSEAAGQPIDLVLQRDVADPTFTLIRRNADGEASATKLGVDER